MKINDYAEKCRKETHELTTRAYELLTVEYMLANPETCADMLQDVADMLLIYSVIKKTAKVINEV